MRSRYRLEAAGCVCADRNPAASREAKNTRGSIDFVYVTSISVRPEESVHAHGRFLTEAELCLSIVIVDIHSHFWEYPKHFSTDFITQAKRARGDVEVDLTGPLGGVSGDRGWFQQNGRVRREGTPFTTLGSGCRRGGICGCPSG